MHLTDVPFLFPGCCNICNGGKGPFIDHTTENAQGERRYTCVQCVKDMARFIGGAGPEEMNAAQEADESHEQLREAFYELEREHAELEAAVAVTLSVGAVFDKRTMRPRLRKPEAGRVLDKSELEEAVPA
jgi:hypothetical protein